MYYPTGNFGNSYYFYSRVFVIPEWCYRESSIETCFPNGFRPESCRNDEIFQFSKNLNFKIIIFLQSSITPAPSIPVRKSMSVFVRTVGLLILSNLFMTFAWVRPSEKFEPPRLAHRRCHQLGRGLF
jgi:hypothetical protein